MKPKLSFVHLIAVGCLFFSGCDFESPLTSAPTRKIDSRLLGNWLSIDKDTKKEEGMTVRKLDDYTYVVSIDGDIYRVYHSDFTGVAFVSAQDLNSNDRKYVYYRWSLSADGNQLTLQTVSTGVIPGETKPSAAIQELIEQNLTNPKLFREELQFTRKKSNGHRGQSGRN